MRSVPAAVLCVLLAPACVTTAQAAGPPVRASQELVALYAPHQVYTHPEAGKSVLTVRAHRPITGARTTLPVLARSVDERGKRWLKVRLPGRTLGRRPPPPTGWITTTNTQLTHTSWHIVVQRAARRVLVYRGGRRARTFGAIIGKPSTPTPHGAFFVEENVRLPAGAAGAPFALATSARSAVLQEFNGGPGQIALHGVRNIGGRLGTAASHGCIRLTSSAITWLAARIRPGTPFTVS